MTNDEGTVGVKDFSGPWWDFSYPHKYTLKFSYLGFRVWEEMVYQQGKPNK